MLPVHKTIHLEGSPLAIIPVGESYIIMDNHYTFYHIVKKGLTLSHTRKIAGMDNGLHAYHKGFMGHGQTVHLPLNTKGSSALLEVGETMTKKATLTWHSADVETAAFSPDGTYVATGGQDGRVYIHHVQSGKLVSSLPARPDAVSALRFSPCGKRLAAATFDKKLVVFDIDRNVTVAKFTTESVIEALTFFDEDGKIFAACREGHAAVFHMPLGEEAWQENKKSFEDWPTVIELSPSGEIALVATRQSRLYFIRLAGNAVIHELSLFKRGITLLRLVDDLLFIGYDDGTLEIMLIDRYLKEFNVTLHLKNFDESRKLLLRQPFLMLHPVMEEFDKEWDAVCSKARELIINRNIDTARKLVQPFMFDPMHKQEFDRLLDKKFVTIHFLDAMHHKDYKQAYAIAEKNEEIKMLRAYVDLERHWQKSFKKARSLVSGKDALANKRHIEHILGPFLKVPQKKVIIDSLLDNHKVCLDAKQLIVRRDFAAFFALAEEHPFLREGDLYRNIFPMIEKVFSQVEALEAQSSYEKALELLSHVESLKPFEERGREFKERLEEKNRLRQAIENQNLVDGYKLVEFSPKLTKSSEFQSFQERFVKDTERALMEAFNGRTARVLDIYDAYLPVDYLQYKIAAVVKVACLYEIRTAIMEKSRLDWPQTIREYVERFGKDGEISRICAKGKLKEILDATPAPVGYTGYLEKGLPDSILIPA